MSNLVDAARRRRTLTGTGPVATAVGGDRWRVWRIFVLGMALAAYVASPGRGDDVTAQPSETLPGFKSHQVYDFSGIDSINLFDGGLNVAIPLGPEYPLSTGLTWRLSAHYSSKLWHMFQYETTTETGGDVCPAVLKRSKRAHVGGYSTLGVGWTLELGSVRPGTPATPAVYKSPDGAHHSRFNSLDLDSDLRLEMSGTYKVRRSDGTVLHFAHKYEIPTPVNGFDFSDEDREGDPTRFTRQTVRYGLTSIVDRFNRTVLRVNYLDECSMQGCPANAWKVSTIELIDRSSSITFHWTTHYEGSLQFPVLESIDFPTVDNGWLTSRFTFQDVGALTRSSFDSEPPVTPLPSPYIEPGPSTTRLPFLSAISQTSVDDPSIQQAYSFQYEPSGEYNSNTLLQTLTLPTGGQVRYTYSPTTAGSPRRVGPGSTFVPEVDGKTTCPTMTPTADPDAVTVESPCTDFEFKSRFTDNSPAVFSRTEVDLPGGTPSSFTTYERMQYGSAGDNQEPIDGGRVVRSVIVTQPDGNAGRFATKHIFAAGEGDPVTGFELSRRYYAGCNSSSTGVLVRSIVQCFQTPGEVSDRVCGVMKNGLTTMEIANLAPVASRRPTQTVTWYGANPLVSNGDTCNTSTAPACWQDVFADFVPDASEYSSVTRSANNGLVTDPQGATRTTTTHWTPVVATDPVTGLETTWLPKVYDWKTVMVSPCTHPPCAVTTHYDFDRANGFLKSSWVVDGSSTLTRALDPSPSGTGDPVTESFSASFDSRTFTDTRTFQSGLVTSVRRTAPNDVGWNSFHVIRDTNIGLVRESRDPNLDLSPTTYAYDPLSRLTDIVPPDSEARTRVCYGNWSGSQGAWAAVRRANARPDCNADPAAPTEGSETAEAYVYDGFGRVTREVRLLPNAVATGTYLAVRTTERNDAGLVSAVSEWAPCGAGTALSTCFSAVVPVEKKTTYSLFDIFGRPTSIRLPDGTRIAKAYDDANDAVSIPFSDTREDTTTTNDAGVGTIRAIRKDIFGRVRIAAEPAMVSVPLVLGPLTFYDYDIHDRLAQVTATRVDEDGSDRTQTRSFNRNAFGFLTSVAHPESGSTTYGSFTAMGWPQEETTDNVTVSKEFDALGRVVKVSSGGAEYSRSYYDGGGGGVQTGSYLGKLTKRIGHNIAAFENARVEDVFVYSGRGGRLSSRQTAFYRAGSTGTPFASLGQSLTWNTFGLLGTRSLSGPGSAFSTETFYTAGVPTRAISGSQVLVSAASYHPYGGLKSYTTGNGVVTKFEADPNGMPRPYRISTSGATTNFDTGPFTYDWAGNVTSMGPVNGSTPADVFTYDRLSRLKTASWNSGSAVGSENFTYDGGPTEKGFGNLVGTSYNGQTPDFSLAVDPLTNRLASGAYDGRGNLIAFPKNVSIPTESFTFDALSRRVSDTRLGSVVSWHLYDGGDERVARVIPALDQPAGALRFHTLSGCRVLDTRSQPGEYGGPFLTAGTPRTFTAPGRCGIPGSAVSLVGNATTIPRADAGGVTGTRSVGFMKLYPADVAVPTATASVINPTKTRGQLVFAKLSSAGEFRLLADLPVSQTVDAILDVSGYFAPLPTAVASRRWLLTQRDEENRPIAEWTWQEGTASVTSQSYHVFLGSMKVATRDVVPTASWAFFASDHLGTPRLRTVTTGPGRPAPTQETYRYRAFGERFPDTLQTDRPGREFAMMERDSILPEGALAASGSGHHYDHARFFADRFARFLSPDQVNGTPEDPQSWNRYTYARNNPLKYVDPDGKSAVAAALPLFGPAINIPVTPLQVGVLAAGGGYAAGRAIGQMQLGGVPIDEHVTQIFTNWIAGPEKTEMPSPTLDAAGINEGKQGKHIPGHNNFIPGRSELTSDPTALIGRAGTGTQVGAVPVGRPGSKERVDFGSVIGVFVSSSGERIPTTRGMIVYDGAGTAHIYPVAPSDTRETKK